MYDVVELEALQAVLLHVVADGVAELAVAAGDHRAARGHGPGVPEHRVVQVGLAALGLLQRNRPLDVQLRVREVHEGVGLLLLEAPVRVDEVRVRGAVFERLEAVAHAARHVDRLGRVEAGGVHLAEALARAQVDPRAEHRAGRDADVLVPRLGVDTAGHAFFALNEMLFCTGPKSGRPSAVIFARCQFSLNQPRLSPCTGRSNTIRPGMFVLSTFSSFSKSMSPIP